jgi:hypothetical protein
MSFPTTEPQISALADQMLAGYFAHGPDFPDVGWMTLFFRIRDYKTARDAMIKAQAKARIETAAKIETLDEMKEVMKNCLKKSQVDVAAEPEKLTLIGWSPKHAPQPSPLPSQPVNLRITYRDNASVMLEWDRPADNSRVRNYIVERRQAQSGGDFTNWTIIEISYQTQARLIKQPTGLQLEYRVKAANNAGESLPGNVTAMIL